jgi:hypothetical protein
MSKLEERNIYKIIQYLKNNNVPGDNIWVVDQAQPTIEFVQPYFTKDYLGRVPHDSGLNPFWDIRLRKRDNINEFNGDFLYSEDYINSARNIFKAHKRLWLFFTRHAQIDVKEIMRQAEDIYDKCQLLISSGNTELYYCYTNKKLY